MAEFWQKIRKPVTFIALGSALGGVPACANTEAPISTPAYSSPSIEVSIDPLSPPEARINLIQTNLELATNEAVLKGEYVQALAEFYCVNIPCNKSVEELTQSVKFLEPEEFIVEIEKISGPLDESMKQTELLSRLEIISADRKSIFMNWFGIQNYALVYAEEHPEVFSSIGSRDLQTVLLQNIILHAFSHAALQTTTYDNPDITFVVTDPENPDKQVEEVYHQMKEFKFNGYNSEGLNFNVVGAEEALVEILAGIAGRKLNSDTYHPLGTNYHDGAELVREVNESSNLSDEALVDLITSQEPQVGLMTLWSSQAKDQERRPYLDALYSLLTIGFYIDGYITRQQAVEAIEAVLNVNFS